MLNVVDYANSDFVDVVPGLVVKELSVMSVQAPFVVMAGICPDIAFVTKVAAAG